MYYKSNIIDLTTILKKLPDAVAVIYGNDDHPDINGVVRFYQTSRGAITVAQISGLPSGYGNCEEPIFGFHIHEGASCTGSGEESFGDTGSHYDPIGCPHPYHAGDMPPLFSASGLAFLAFISNRFSVSEIIGRTVIIHSMPDDFTSQPSGNVGDRIACGKIVR